MCIYIYIYIYTYTCLADQHRMSFWGVAVHLRIRRFPVHADTRARCASHKSRNQQDQVLTYRKVAVSHSVSGVQLLERHPVGRGTLVFVKIWVPSPTR